MPLKGNDAKLNSHVVLALSDHQKILFLAHAENPFLICHFVLTIHHQLGVTHSHPISILFSLGLYTVK